MAIDLVDAGGRGDPRRSPPGGPVIDEYSAAVREEATVTLTLLRTPMRLGDRLAELHATVSLMAELQARLPTVVAAARDQGHDWADIAEALGVSATTAKRRYRDPSTNER